MRVVLISKKITLCFVLLVLFHASVYGQIEIKKNANNDERIEFKNSTKNTIIGDSAGVNNTGQRNTFFGFEAGRVNSASTGNVFIGAGSGRVNTTGFRNTFIGENAGYSNTTAAANTLLGWYAGRSNTTG